MFFKDFKEIEPLEATRRKFLKFLTQTGTLSALGLLGPFKKIGFAKESDISPEEMREKAMKLFHRPTLFQ